MLRRYLLNPNRSSEAECNDLFGTNDRSQNLKLSMVLEGPETDNSNISHPKRNTLFSPYKGFAIDQAALAVSYGEGVSNIESQSIVRNMTYKEKLANKLHIRHTYNFIKKIFTLWKRHSFRYVFLRRQLLKCYLMNFISRRFRCWYMVTRREALLRKYIRKYWRNHRNIRYICWKLDTRWRTLKEKLYKFGFRHMLIHLAYQRRMNMRWHRIKTMYQRLISALILQRGQRRHSKRRKYWANRVIKRFFMCFYGIRLVQERKRMERQRITMELETSDVLVERGLTYLKNLLQEDVGRELHSLYLKAIKVILRKTNETLGDIQPMFPNRREMPGIGAMWTTNGKAMYILKHRCEVEIRKLARDKFRLFSPPIYECKNCHCVCFLRIEIRNHRMFCQYDEAIDDQPQYVSWRLAQPVAEGALAPLKKHYAKQLKTMKANGVKTNLEYLHRLKSAKSLIPSKPLKHARSMSTKDGASISLARSLGRKSSKGYQEGPGESRQLSTADSVYSMAHSVDLSGGDMSQLGLEKSNMGSSRYRNDSFTSASGMSAITAPDKPHNKSRSFTKPHSLYKSKSQRLLANAVFADGGTTCIKTREEDDRREEQEANSRDEDDDRAETAHDESVDDWF